MIVFNWFLFWILFMWSLFVVQIFRLQSHFAFIFRLYACQTTFSVFLLHSSSMIINTHHHWLLLISKVSVLQFELEFIDLLLLILLVLLTYQRNLVNYFRTQCRITIQCLPNGVFRRKQVPFRRHYENLLIAIMCLSFPLTPFWAS